MAQTQKKMNIRNLVLFAMFVAILILMGAIPMLGMIPLGLMYATTLHIPVIVGAIILGPKFGAALGGVFGIISMWKSTVAGTATAFVFSPLVPVPGVGHGSPWALVVAMVPRILIGITSYYAYAVVKKIFKKDAVAMGVGAFVGSMTNTIFVMGLIYVLFSSAYAGAIDLGGRTLEAFIGLTVVVNGIPEALVAVVISVAVCKALKAYMNKGKANA